MSRSVFVQTFPPLLHLSRLGIVVSGLEKRAAQAARLAQAGRHAEAVPIWEELHRKRPDEPAVCLALGAALMGCDRVDDAAAWAARSARAYPDHSGLAHLFGQVLVRQGHYRAALGAFFHALSLAPDSANLHADIANALYRDRKSAAALPYAEQACHADTTVANLSTYFCILVDLDRGAEALACIDRLLVADPTNQAAYTLFRAAALMAVGRMREGLAASGEAVRLAPDNPTARHHYAAALLIHGEMNEVAWQHYEARAALLDRKTWPAEALRWTTQDIDGLTILVHAEQGLGDTLQFIRYVPLLAARGARVVVAVQPSLVRLLQGTAGAAEVISAGFLPRFDLYCPLLSLPGRLGTTLETIPPPTPYAVQFPKAAMTSRLQVGLVWAGRDIFVDDRKRSLDPSLLEPLGTVSGVDFHSLQYGAETMPLSGMHDAMTGVTDFLDTAVRIAKLDLVIAVDTSVAHLAATMGKPVWLLARHNGCWRWLLEREDSPWYPSVRLFRQQIGDDWITVVEAVRAALVQAAAAQQGAIAAVA